MLITEMRSSGTAVVDPTSMFPAPPPLAITNVMHAEMKNEDTVCTTMSLSQSMESVNTTPEEEVRTLFVSGLPMDAKPRELYLLFRSYKGFENGLLKQMGKIGNKLNNGFEGSLLKVTNKNGKNTSPVGFVTFNSRVAAETAKQDLQGVRFDPDIPQTLRLEFAKSNTKVQKPKQQSPQPAATHPTLIHPITGQEFGTAFFPATAGGIHEAWPPHPLAAYQELAAPGTAAAFHHTALIQHPALAPAMPAAALRLNPMMVAHPAGMAIPATPISMAAIQVPQKAVHPAMVAHHQVGLPAAPFTPMSQAHIAGNPLIGSPLNTGSCASPVGLQHNAPCSTLFVANLGQFSSEQELKDLFSSFPGFNRLRMHNKGGAPVSFVEFQDVRQASEAMNRLQGFVLLSSERGGIRIEYAKHKMGDVILGLPGWAAHYTLASPSIPSS